MKYMYSTDKESFHYQLLKKSKPYVCDSLKMKIVTDKVTQMHLHCTHQHVNGTAVVGHDVAEILLKVALNSNNKIKNII